MQLAINAQTKISTLIKAHPDALERIVAISPDFKKLRHPFLRKLMAGRTTIAMAARIGGCKPEDFFAALAPLGFIPDAASSNNEIINSEPSNNPPLPQLQWITFDVRPILDQDQDPLRSIQEKIKALKPDQGLIIINRFAPAPLISLIEKQGFNSQVRQIEENLFQTYFFRPDPKDLKETPGDASVTFPKPPTNSDKQVNTPDEVGFDPWTYFQDRYQVIDVRALPMPQPMMKILEKLDSIAEDQALFVYHKKIPQFLLPELDERGFNFAIQHIADGEVNLLIYRPPSARP